MKGLCIGGPLDGRFKDAEGPLLIAPIPPKIVVAFGPPDEVKLAQRAVYEFHVWHSDDAPEGYGFWALEGMGPRDIMDRLIERYEKP